MAGVEAVNNYIKRRCTKSNSLETSARPSPEPSHPEKSKSQRKDPKNIFLAVVVLLAAVTKFYGIDLPSEVVFDEVHFGGFANSYLRREYFFDVHPPLGKLMIAAIGCLMGYKGDFTFSTIGQSYAGSSAPYVAMRMMMAGFGVLTVGLSYLTMCELGFSALSASFSAWLVIFDMASCIQSRFILLDSPLLGFISCALYSWVRFRKERCNPFSTSWWRWLSLTGAALGAATSVKLVGLFTVASIGMATLEDLWTLAGKNQRLSNSALWKHVFARALCLIAIPTLVYGSSFWAHFAILNRSGPGDAYMSSSFQETLIGNKLRMPIRTVRFGHTIRLKSLIEDLFLHSHLHNYPGVYPDGSASSGGQQVTGYASWDDPNNLWRILPVNSKTRDPLRSGDTIQLLHVATDKLLMTHEIKSPSRTGLELTLCERDSLTKSTVWKLELIKGESPLRTKASQIRLISTEHKAFLTSEKESLPAWGFDQREICADSSGLSDRSKWLIWDIQESPDEKEDQQAFSKMSIFQKYLDLQKLVLWYNSDLIREHPFRSDPSEWPFSLKGILFWARGEAARIYLTGNPLAWYAALIGILAFVGLAAKEIFREHRGCFEGKPDRFRQSFAYRGGLLFMSYLLHYLPFFTMSRTLFLHHYLPAYTISAMIAGATLDFFLHLLRDRPLALGLLTFLLALFMAALALAFFYYAPIVYGTITATDLISGPSWLSTRYWVS